MNPNKPEFGDEIQIPEIFETPEYANQKAAWFEIVPMLMKAGVATEIDVFALQMLCEKWVELRNAQGKVNETGLVTKAPSGYPMINPYYTITMQLQKEVRSLLTEFGMTAAARQKVVADKGAAKAKTEFADIS